MKKPEFYEYFADCTPALTIPALDPFHKMTRDYWGKGISFQMMPIEGIRARYYIRRKETLDLGEYFVNKLIKKPGLFEKAMNELAGEIGKIDKFKEQISSISLKDAPTAKLFILETSINEHYMACLQKGYIVEPSYFYLEHVIRERLGKFLSRKRMGKYYSKYFVALTPIAGEPYHVTEEKSLLSIMAIIAKEGLSVGAKDMLADHAREFYWINDSYAITRELDVKYFLKMIGEKERAGIDPARQLAGYKKKALKREFDRKKAISELHLPPQLQKYTLLVGKIAYIQDARKIGILKCVHLSAMVLKEIGRRFGIKYPLILYISPHELDSKLLSDPAFHKELKKRSKNCLLIFNNIGTFVHSGAKAKKLEKETLGNYNPSMHGATTSVRGICASLGYAVGRARIVLSASEVHKVKLGEVLVVSSTRPDMVPAMKNACAIVADEGGITSHAAIVSRELGKPCIIGAKIATKAFKDGDLLEVKANHGEVNKLEG